MLRGVDDTGLMSKMGIFVLPDGAGAWEFCDHDGLVVDGGCRVVG